MSAAALSTEEHVELRRAVVELASATGFERWGPADAAKRAGLDPARLEAEGRTAELLVLDAAFCEMGAALASLGDGAGAKVAGRTPRSRVLRSFAVLTELVTEQPAWGRSVVQAMVAGQPDALPAAAALGERLHMAVARALAGGEPGDPEWAASGLVLQAWLAAVVLWAAGLRSTEHIEESVVRALRLLKVNQ